MVTPGGVISPTSGLNWCRDVTWSWNGTSEKLSGSCCYRTSSANACKQGTARYMKSKSHPVGGFAEGTADHDKINEGCWNPSNPGIDIWCCKECAGGNEAPYYGGGGGPTSTQMPTSTPILQPSSTPTATPSPTPTLIPTTPILFFKAQFQGFSAGNQPKMRVSLSAAGTSFSQAVILSEKGESEAVILSGLTASQTYQFLLSGPGFLTAKKSLTISAGRNPSSGFLDFGTLKTGDLNADDQVNGLDWSWMKGNYGDTGEN